MKICHGAKSASNQAQEDWQDPGPGSNPFLLVLELGSFLDLVTDGRLDGDQLTLFKLSLPVQLLVSDVLKFKIMK